MKNNQKYFFLNSHINHKMKFLLIVNIFLDFEKSGKKSLFVKISNKRQLGKMSYCDIFGY
jgi:hypothetical protein